MPSFIEEIQLNFYTAESRYLFLRVPVVISLRTGFRKQALSMMEIIVAATMENACFFCVDERLENMEKGKLEDTILEGDHLKDIKAIYSVRRVMMNGMFIFSNKK